MFFCGHGSRNGAARSVYIYAAYRLIAHGIKFAVAVCCAVNCAGKPACDCRAVVRRVGEDICAAEIGAEITDIRILYYARKRTDDYSFVNVRLGTNHRNFGLNAVVRNVGPGVDVGARKAENTAGINAYACIYIICILPIAAVIVNNIRKTCLSGNRHRRLYV